MICVMFKINWITPFQSLDRNTIPDFASEMLLGHLYEVRQPTF